MTALSLGDLTGIIPQYQSLHKLLQDLDGVDARVGQPQAQLWAWILARQVRWSHWGHASCVGADSALLHTWP